MSSLFLRILNLQRLRRLFVAVGFKQVVDLCHNGVELLSDLLVRGVIGGGGNLPAQVFEFIQTEQDRSACDRGSDCLGNPFVDVYGTSKDELSFLDGKLEANLLFFPKRFVPAHDPLHSWFVSPAVGSMLILRWLIGRTLCSKIIRTRFDLGSIDSSIQLSQQPVQVERPCVHCHVPLGRPGPRLLGTVPVKLDPVVIGVTQIEGLADAVVTGTVQPDPSFDQTTQCVGETFRVG